MIYIDWKHRSQQGDNLMLYTANNVGNVIEFTWFGIFSVLSNLFLSIRISRNSNRRLRCNGKFNLRIYQQKMKIKSQIKRKTQFHNQGVDCICYLFVPPRLVQLSSVVTNQSLKLNLFVCDVECRFSSSIC